MGNDELLFADITALQVFVSLAVVIICFCVPEEYKFLLAFILTIILNVLNNLWAEKKSWYIELFGFGMISLVLIGKYLKADAFSNVVSIMIPEAIAALFIISMGRQVIIAFLATVAAACAVSIYDAGNQNTWQPLYAITTMLILTEVTVNGGFWIWRKLKQPAKRGLKEKGGRDE